jgi:hypothetical protein
MTFAEALKLMKKNSKIRIQASWYLKHDYLYLENGKIMCDGGFEYSLSARELTTKTWKIIQEEL